MKKLNLMLMLCCFLMISCIKTAPKPNVLIIYSDDIGYGDIGVYGADLIPTPNIDQLAAKGIRFTDGHCAASTCSPSRYALLTGEMGFRKNIGIQPVNAPLSIRTEQFTLPRLFQSVGYQTGIIGKWHLGLGSGALDWNDEIRPGPLEVGFDYSFIIPSTNDRSPFVYVENHRVFNHDPNDPITVSLKRIPDSIPGTAYPDAQLEPESITVYKGDVGHQCTVINGVGRIGYMKGGKKAVWNDHNIADDLLKKAQTFISERKDQPFFLMLSTNDIHAPRLPHPRFKGTTDLGYRGDNVVQLDWFVGEVIKSLKENGLEEKTMVIFSSDNGPVYIDGGYQDGSANQKHRAAGLYRGGKYQIYEGGTRVPLIISWPGMIEPMVSDALVSQVDLLASFAAFFERKLPEGDAQDSRNYWNTFIGREQKGAEIILEQTNTKKSIAIRKNNFKYLRLHDGSFEMYDLNQDPEEKYNLVSTRKELAREMHKELTDLENSGLNQKY